jgi:hypothetical protein
MPQGGSAFTLIFRSSYVTIALAIGTAEHYGISDKEAKKFVKEISAAVR